MITLAGMSGNTYGHYAIVFIPAIIYPLSILESELRKNKTKSLTDYLIIVVIFFLTLSQWMNRIVSLKHQLYLTKDNRNIDEDIESIVSAIDWNTCASDRITVCGNWDIIYDLSKRISVSKYSYQSPICQIDTSKENEYLLDIAEKKPKIVVLRNDFYLYDDIKNIVDNDDYKKICTVKDATVYCR